MKQDNKEPKTNRSQSSSSGSDKNAQQRTVKKTGVKEFEKGSSGNSEQKKTRGKTQGDDSDIDDESTI